MRPNVRLSLLVGRRTLGSGGLLGLVLAPAVLVAAGRPAPSPGLSERAVRSLARQELWTAMLLVLVPLVVARCAGALGRWRRGEAQWLVGSVGGLGGALASTFLGALGAGALALALAAGATRVLAGADTDLFRLEGTLDNDLLILARDGDRVGIEIPSPTERWSRKTGGSVWIELRSSGPGGAEITARWGTETSVVRLTGPEASARIPVPAEPARRLSLTRTGAGPPVFVPARSVRLVARAGNGAVDLGILLHAGVALAAWLALALGATAWTRPQTALLGLAVAQAAVWLAERPLAIWPGAALSAVLDRAGSGLASPPPSSQAVLSAAAACAIGLGLAVLCPDAGTRR